MRLPHHFLFNVCPLREFSGAIGEAFAGEAFGSDWMSFGIDSFLYPRLERPAQSSRRRSLRPVH